MMNPVVDVKHSGYVVQIDDGNSRRRRVWYGWLVDNILCTGEFRTKCIRALVEGLIRWTRLRRDCDYHSFIRMTFQIINYNYCLKYYINYFFLNYVGLCLLQYTQLVRPTFCVGYLHSATNQATLLPKAPPIAPPPAHTTSLSCLSLCPNPASVLQYADRPPPRAGSGVVRIDPLRFLAGCRTRRLNQVLSVLSLSLDFCDCICCAVN